MVDNRICLWSTNCKLSYDIIIYTYSGEVIIVYGRNKAVKAIYQL
jgi:hypothetical protein